MISIKNALQFWFYYNIIVCLRESSKYYEKAKALWQFKRVGAHCATFKVKRGRWSPSPATDNFLFLISCFLFLSYPFFS